MFSPYRQTDRRLGYVLICQFLICKLRMSRCSRMDHKRFDIGYIGKKREYLKIVYELERCILAALDLKMLAPPFGK